jgi:hypothetical protein
MVSLWYRCVDLVRRLLFEKHGVLRQEGFSFVFPLQTLLPLLLRRRRLSRLVLDQRVVTRVAVIFVLALRAQVEAGALLTLEPGPNDRFTAAALAAEALVHTQVCHGRSRRWREQRRRQQ